MRGLTDISRRADGLWEVFVSSILLVCDDRSIAQQIAASIHDAILDCAKDCGRRLWIDDSARPARWEVHNLDH